jgi:hypothetical protein
VDVRPNPKPQTLNPKQHEHGTGRVQKHKRMCLCALRRFFSLAYTAYYLAADLNTSGKIAIGLADTLLITHIIPIVVEHEFLCERQSRSVESEGAPKIHSASVRVPS